eukprot:TRINITY_DN66917_c7_g2_i1.p1 TRINITY_DN66917_c7_g2~~TRINITY_DN66917_c7_g2_i1.p1  ORF type:complete len:806 (+),score=184.51 TRINITY_DN66917_c7_g2_i1:417-2834(+)
MECSLKVDREKNKTHSLEKDVVHLKHTVEMNKVEINEWKQKYKIEVESRKKSDQRWEIQVHNLKIEIRATCDTCDDRCRELTAQLKENDEKIAELYKQIEQAQAETFAARKAARAERANAGPTLKEMQLEKEVVELEFKVADLQDKIEQTANDIKLVHIWKERYEEIQGKRQKFEALMADNAAMKKRLREVTDVSLVERWLASEAKVKAVETNRAKIVDELKEKTCELEKWHSTLHVKCLDEALELIVGANKAKDNYLRPDKEREQRHRETLQRATEQAAEIEDMKKEMEARAEKIEKLEQELTEQMEKNAVADANHDWWKERLEWDGVSIEKKKKVAGMERQLISRIDQQYKTNIKGLQLKISQLQAENDRQAKRWKRFFAQQDGDLVVDEQQQQQDELENDDQQQSTTNKNNTNDNNDVRLLQQQQDLQKKEIETLKARNNELQALCNKEDIKKELDQKIQQLQQLNNKIVAMNKASQNLQKQLDEATQQKQSASKELQQTDSQRTQAMARAQQLETENSQIKAALKDTEAQLTDERVQHEKTKQQHRQQQQQQQQLPPPPSSPPAAGQGPQPAALQKQLEECQKQIQDLQAKLAAKQKDLLVARNTNAKAEGAFKELSDVKQQLEESKQQAKALQEGLVQAEKAAKEAEETSAEKVNAAKQKVVTAAQARARWLKRTLGLKVITPAEEPEASKNVAFHFSSTEGLSLQERTGKDNVHRLVVLPESANVLQTHTVLAQKYGVAVGQELEYVGLSGFLCEVVADRHKNNQSQAVARSSTPSKAEPVKTEELKASPPIIRRRPPQ